MESISLFTERIIISGLLTLCGRYYISWIDRIYNTYIGLFKAIMSHVLPTGLGLILLGDLTTIWETPETSDDDFWKNQEDWEIIRELKDEGWLEPGKKIEDESEIAITLIHPVHFVDNRRCSPWDYYHLLASIATMTRQTDAEQGRPTFKKLEVKQVEFKLGEDCWEIQVKKNIDPTRFTQKVNIAKAQAVNTARQKAVKTARPNTAVVNAVGGKTQQNDTGFVDSGCSRHMTGNIVYLSDFKEFDRGYVTFRGGAHGGRISGKGTLKTDSLDFEDVYFVNELKFNLFSVSQMCDKKNYVLFTDTECLVLSPNFKLPDENHILLKIPRKDNMYSFDMKNIVPKETLTCLVAKATSDESMLWHRRLGHINFKNINKLVKDNLVRGLPTKHFENDQTCVACLKGKQHRASCKSKVLNPITKPLFMLHMDLFGLTFVSSLMHMSIALGIKREYSVARTPQQNGVAERRNRTLIEAARTMLADSKFYYQHFGLKKLVLHAMYQYWSRSQASYKTPYELFKSLGKFDGKSDESFFVGYSLSSKAFRVYNTRTRRVEENLHIGFLENKPMIEGNGTQEELNVGISEEISKDCIVMPIWKDASYFDSPSKDVDNGESKSDADDQKQDGDGPDIEYDEQDKSNDVSSPKEVNAAGQHINTTSPDVNTGSFKLNIVDASVNTASSND
ncbi:ribonuclease H-like domain-containing protein [Tanacetum coccineum]